MLPGDICDLHVAILGQMDHGIGTLTDCQIVRIPRTRINDMLDNYRRIRHALFWPTLVDEAILGQWLVNMGRRRADHQMAHLFCEIHMRLQAVDQLHDSFMPLTQEELGDILGMSSVHAQRVEASLRQMGLINVQASRVSVLDFDALSAFAGFEADYLHLGDMSVRSPPILAAST